nr:hypothetical protein [Tanacetum cinerariifolium]
MCEIFCQSVQKKQEEKRIEEEQAVKAQSWKFPVCYDDDDDEEGYNSLNDNINSELPSYSAFCVENLVPNPSESEGKNGCDVPAGFTTFSNVLFDADYDSDSSDDQSLSDEANSLNDSPSISETSSQSPSNINHCCYECGDPLDGIFCKHCTCKFCGKDAHIGYNCPSKVSVISIPKPCTNQTIDELPQALPIFHPTFHFEAESPFTLDSTPTYVDESPNVFNPHPQSPVYPCEFCWNDAYYGHYCTPQAPFIYLKQCYNQDFNFPQDFQDVPQQYPCCDDCGVTHDAYQ